MISIKATFAFALIAIAFLSSTNAFVSSQNKLPKFGGSTSLKMTLLSANGKKIEFKEGSPLKNAAAKLGVKPKYSCRKGDCGSCTLSVGGTRVKACVGKVPPAPRLKSLQEKGLEVK
uniref:2Fe-2S ferredoxin-type domain-containing protein n=1 Tax=Helicotheca tamesis TaxID=374047 RepID=A0A7S2HVR3_9STRA|mmetsp:Transcript_3001/g.4052  ORF Transcript_3001/g.4052 Transcript_3001/m.4052 type:complete len:117 (+) Transcript_3001:150-500(+)|eukprot:CAMPEP_0185726608 /NCGR_PEP_ID=MMETSP1171-20130828/2531_1 /TAXON_ID=374046 /ORGANISM="Helicotheca tamensis, Strain CCMP826" /LENGTH=116 /DNA_ID=CAMNT_0028394993 /DNA_START=98 /DNA_END=448 /DNA_ORIENTATION=+